MTFDKILEKYDSKLRSFAFKLVGQSVDDVMQEVRLSMWKSKDRINWDAPMGVLYTIVKRRAADHWRVRDNWAKTGLTGQPIGADASEDMFECIVYEEAKDNELDPKLQQALETLNPQIKHCVIGVVVEGYTHQQMADRLGVKLGTVLSRVCRGRKLLKKELERNG